MRIIFVVAVLVMSTVGGHPLKHGAFDSHGPHQQEACFNRPRCAEAFMGEVPVIPDGDSGRSDEVHDGKDAKADAEETDEKASE